MENYLDIHVNFPSETDSESDTDVVIDYYSRADVLAALPSRHTLAALQSRSGASLKHQTLDNYASILRLQLSGQRSAFTLLSNDEVDEAGAVDVAGAEDTVRRLNYVRSLPSSITVKRQARSQLLSSPKKILSGYTKWKYEKAREWQRIKQSIRAFLNILNIWSGAFKTIEGSFGSSVVSFFQFIRWLFLLNLFTFVCILGCVILPQAFLSPGKFEDSIVPPGVSRETVNVTTGQDEALNCSAIYMDKLANETKTNIGSIIISVFQGTGIVENTFVFIGYYFNKTHFYDLSRTNYDLPLVYLLMTAGYLFITLILMVRYTAEGVKEKLLSKGDKFYKASCMVFCGWDYNLTKGLAATYKHVSLEHEMTRLLSGQRREEERRNMSTYSKCFLYFKRIAINLFSLLCLAGSAALIYYIVEVWKPQLLKHPAVIASDFFTLLVEFLPSGTITALNFICPIMFIKLVIYENYSPAVELKINIIRIAFLRFASLVILAISMFGIISCDKEDMVCSACHEEIPCWETFVGQELYKLVIMDFVVMLVTTFLVEFPRKVITTKVKKLQNFTQEFDLPKNVLGIVYTQTLSWWGGFYSPLIPCITVFKLFVIFYLKKLSLMHNQNPPSRPYRASKSTHFFMVVLMVSFCMSVAAIVYSIGKITPSQSCSPFRIHITENFMMFNSINAAVATLPTIAQKFFNFVISWICYVSLFIITCLTIFYQTAKSSGSKQLAELLEEQRALVEKDKQFLLKQVNTALGN